MDVIAININIQNVLPGETITYKSVNTVMYQNKEVNYITEFLNSLYFPGLPPHIINLKIAVPNILFRNINPQRLCNGTILQ